GFGILGSEQLRKRILGEAADAPRAGGAETGIRAAPCTTYVAMLLNTSEIAERVVKIKSCVGTRERIRISSISERNSSAERSGGEITRLVGMRRDTGIHIACASKCLVRKIDCATVGWLGCYNWRSRRIQGISESCGNLHSIAVGRLAIGHGLRREGAH